MVEFGRPFVLVYYFECCCCLFLVRPARIVFLLCRRECIGFMVSEESECENVRLVVVVGYLLARVGRTKSEVWVYEDNEK